MQPDLSSHLHTKECNFLVNLLMECYQNNIIGKFFGKCNYWDEAVWQCTKQERIHRKNTNPSYGLRVVEDKRLPEELYTEPLKKLKKEGVLILDEKGCKI